LSFFSKNFVLSDHSFAGLSFAVVLQVFEELLLDADWALNAGNWMWLSASAFFHQYFR
jgi:cryptochrome